MSASVCACVCVWGVSVSVGQSQRKRETEKHESSFLVPRDSDLSLTLEESTFCSKQVSFIVDGVNI